MTLLNVVTGALLLLAGLSRGMRSPARRTVAAALLAAAVAVLLAEVARQATGWHAGPPTARARLVDDLTLARLLAVTLSGSATFALARRVSRSPALVPMPPAPLGMAVALAQIVLWVVASHRAAPGQAIVQTMSAEAVALMAVTVGWPALAAVALIGPLRAFTPAIAAASARFGLTAILVGIGGIGLGAALTGGLVVSPAAPPSLSSAAAALTDAGLIAVALGDMASPVSRLARPLGTWLRSAWATRKLAPLIAALSTTTPEWAHPDLDRSTALARPHIRLYQQIIFIRDASWTLLAEVDDGVVAHAVDFAREQVPRPQEQDVAALAEACWLRFALHRRSTRMPPLADAGDQEMEILHRVAGEPAGTVPDEVRFLVSLARFWQRTELLDQFLAHLADVGDRTVDGAAT